MKIRTGFVSNISSSSFVLVVITLDDEQKSIVNDAIANINEQDWCDGGYIHKSKVAYHGSVDNQAWPILKEALIKAKIDPSLYDVQS